MDPLKQTTDLLKQTMDLQKNRLYGPIKTDYDPDCMDLLKQTVWTH